MHNCPLRISLAALLLVAVLVTLANPSIASEPAINELTAIDVLLLPDPTMIEPRESSQRAASRE